MNKFSILSKRVLLAHSNDSPHYRMWHKNREITARQMGYQLNTFCMTDFLQPMLFPALDRLWKKRDSSLMRMYEVLGEKIDRVDVFIHFNGGMIHPEFLSQFGQIKIYHCADDPDSSELLSRPVASSYDIHGISNPACIEMYESWGLKNVFFWPLGGFYADNLVPDLIEANESRDIPLGFVGNKYGSTKYRYVSHIPLINRMSWPYYKKAFFQKICNEFQSIVAFGDNWPNGRIEDSAIPDIYGRTSIGLNVHNSLGPINARLYDLAAFGVCQICDNKENLHHVFKLDEEIVGFKSTQECIDLIKYYLAHSDEARKIGVAAKKRYLKDYTTEAIWKNFFSKIDAIMISRLKE
jgi:hypothetical protein